MSDEPKIGMSAQDIEMMELFRKNVKEGDYAIAFAIMKLAESIYSLREKGGKNG